MMPWLALLPAYWVRPIYAIKTTASGDISLPKDATSSDAIAWSNTAGTYIPTPLYYNGILYTMNNDGILTAYDWPRAR